MIRVCRKWWLLDDVWVDILLIDLLVVIFCGYNRLLWLLCHIMIFYSLIWIGVFGKCIWVIWMVVQVMIFVEIIWIWWRYGKLMLWLCKCLVLMVSYWRLYRCVFGYVWKRYWLWILISILWLWVIFLLCFCVCVV